MKKDESMTRRERWATFRFSVVGSLLSLPLDGEHLRQRLLELAAIVWKHPINGMPIRFGFSTIERWYYRAKKKEHRPIEALEKKLRSDIGDSRRLTDAQKTWLAAQYRKTPHWRYARFSENLTAQCKLEPASMGDPPSYSTVRRYMKAQGLIRIPKSRSQTRPGYQEALTHRFEKETLSYEASHPGSLFHLDFHGASRQVLLKTGELVTPQGLAILDDHSRLCCHVQWYLNGSTEELVHGVMQAFLKRGMPNTLMSDNGKPMLSAEFQQGLRRLGIRQSLTLRYSPWQNGKQERFWGTLEEQLLRLFDAKPKITLREINEATQVWVEHSYHANKHSEIDATPHDAYYHLKPCIARKSPSLNEIEHAFRRQESRRLRRQDGTISVEGKRYQIPSRYHDLERILVRYAQWNLAEVFLICPRTGTTLCRLFPVDKQQNSSGRRPDRHWVLPEAPQPEFDDTLPPVLRLWMQEQEQTGLPYPYIPKDDEEED